MAVLLYFSQCLFYALDRWFAEGGGIVFVKSTHWFIPHVQHLSRRGVLTHFVPPGDLRAAWHCLFGFYGTVETGDRDDRLPMSKIGMLFGILLMLIGWTVWVTVRAGQKLTRPIP